MEAVLTSYISSDYLLKPLASNINVEGIRGYQDKEARW